jgi:Putative transposase
LLRRLVRILCSIIRTLFIDVLNVRHELSHRQDQWYVADTVADKTDTSALKPLQQGSIVYRIAFGPRAGRKVLTLREALPIDTEIDYESKPLCANEQGFSLHAAVPCHANERLRLERLCRYITRPALANDRVKINGQGQVELKLKTPWRDGTTHHVMSQLGIEVGVQPRLNPLPALWWAIENRCSDPAAPNDR